MQSEIGNEDAGSRTNRESTSTAGVEKNQPNQRGLSLLGRLQRHVC